MAPVEVHRRLLPQLSAHRGDLFALPPQDAMLVAVGHMGLHAEQAEPVLQAALLLDGPKPITVEGRDEYKLTFLIICTIIFCF